MLQFSFRIEGDAMSDEAAAQASEAPASVSDDGPEDESAGAVAIILISSQQNTAVVGLAPHANVPPPLSQPSLSSPSDVVGRAFRWTTEGAWSADSGWWLQAAWTVALAAFAWAVFRPLGPLGAAVGLFSRLDRDEVLENDRRARLADAVQADPGVTLGVLCHRVGLARGVAQHHLRLLEIHGKLRRVRSGRATHFYPAGPRFAPPAALAPARARIIEMVRHEPGLSARDLAGRLGQRVQSTWEQLQRLRDAGVLAAQPDGRRFRWHVAMSA
jgi:DNA-binding transcriptional ArsR family regulator